MGTDNDDYIPESYGSWHDPNRNTRIYEAWLANDAAGPDDPTWPDLHRKAVQRWRKEHAPRNASEQDLETAERAELARLQAKYSPAS